MSGVVAKLRKSPGIVAIRERRPEKKTPAAGMLQRSLQQLSHGWRSGVFFLWPPYPAEMPEYIVRRNAIGRR